MIKAIILILIVLVLTTACGGAGEPDMPICAGEGCAGVPGHEPTASDPFSNLAYLGQLNERVLVYRFNDGDTSCWVSVGKWDSSTSIYCQ